MNAFNIKHETETFPHEQVEESLYRSFRLRLHNLADANPDKYEEFIKNKFNDKIIDKFIGIENEVLGLANNIERFASPKSKTYEEVALAANKEQEIWSDKAASPPLSPQFIQETVMETIEKDQHKSPLEEFWDKLKNKNNLEDTSIDQPIASSSNVLTKDLNQIDVKDQTNIDNLTNINWKEEIKFLSNFQDNISKGFK